MQMPAKVFICYSHEDVAVKTELVTCLAPLTRMPEPILTWHDEQIKHSDPWQERIEKELCEADAAILLISPEFYASDFIDKVELPKIQEKRGGHGFRVYPILTRSTFIPPGTWLSRLEMRPKEKGKLIPLSGLTKNRREKFYVEFCETLASAAPTYITETVV